jgi:hypothetical protein
MSEAAAELNFPGAEDAGMLDLPQRAGDGAPNEYAGDHDYKPTGARIAAAVSMGLARIRAGVAGGSKKATKEGETASVNGVGDEAATQQAEGNGEALRAEAQDRPPTIGKPEWVRYGALGTVSAIAITVAVVAFWPNGQSPVVFEKGVGPDAGLMAPASKLAAVPPPNMERHAVVEVPPESPPHKVVEEVASFWQAGSAKEAEKSTVASSPASPAIASKTLAPPPSVTEAGLSAPATALETPKASQVAEAKEKKPAPPAAMIASATIDAAVETPPKAKEQDSKRVATVASDTVPRTDEKAIEQESKLSSMITELSTLVRRTREEIAALQESNQKAGKAIDAKLMDFERRLNIGEAQRALDAAKATPTAPQEQQSASAAPTPAAKAATGGTKGLVMASLSTEGAAAAGGVTAPAAAARYPIQAASPGLALLSEIDRSGDDAAPLQIAVGANVPGYGRVTKISQRGTEWIVQTEKGAIR